MHLLEVLRHPRRAHFQHVTTQFHKWLYGDARLFETSWMGFKLQKLPLDLWVYQEIIWDTKPDLIVETGTMHGGSALYMASICDIFGRGEVVSIDLEKRKPMPQHDRITFLAGRSSTDPEVVNEVRAMAEGKRVMVILDSDHSELHVTDELAVYADLVSSGCHLIVEDTNVNGHPVLPEHGPGPMEALDKWAPLHTDFERVPLDERYLISMNPKGYFRRR